MSYFRHFRRCMTMAEQLKEHIKDPGSAITHFIGMLMAIFAAIPLLLKQRANQVRFTLSQLLCMRQV